jgi:hypothetical protein
VTVSACMTEADYQRSLRIARAQKDRELENWFTKGEWDDPKIAEAHAAYMRQDDLEGPKDSRFMYSLAIHGEI